jgi:hypothetical protein
MGAEFEAWRDEAGRCTDPQLMAELHLRSSQSAIASE